MQMNKDDFEISELFSRAEFEEFKTLDNSFASNLENSIIKAKKNRALFVEAAQYFSIAIMISALFMLLSGNASINLESLNLYFASLGKLNPHILILAFIGITSIAAIGFANQE